MKKRVFACLLAVLMGITSTVESSVVAAAAGTGYIYDKDIVIEDSVSIGDNLILSGSESEFTSENEYASDNSVSSGNMSGGRNDALQQAIQVYTQTNDLQYALMLLAEDAEEGSLQDLINQAVETEETEDDTIVLVDDYKENIVIPENADITIDLNGHSISPDNDMRITDEDLNTITLFGNLTLKDSVETGAVTNDENLEKVRGVYVNFRSEFTLESGTINGFSAAENGGGVYVGNQGKFAMNGGTISNNISGNFGGGVYVHDGQGFDLTGGTISGNQALYGGGLAIISISDQLFSLTSEKIEISNNEATNGGGIWLGAGSVFEMSAGTVSDNVVTTNGGGIYLESSTTFPSTFTMSGGVVRGNSITSDVGYGAGIYTNVGSAVKITGDALIAENTHARYGSGLCVWMDGSLLIEGGIIRDNSSVVSNAASGAGVFSYSNMTMTGGLITGNRAEIGASRGGGLYVASTATLNMSGGIISENHAYYGGGVCVSNTTATAVTVSGDAVISDNTGSAGGGIYMNGIGLLTLKDNAVISGNKAIHGGGIRGAVCMEGGKVCNNTATGDGGGIYTEAGSGTSFSGGEIAGNSAKNYGGGMYVNASGAYGVEIAEDILIAGNTATYGGGVLCICGELTLSGGTITENSSTYGGGVGIEVAVNKTVSLLLTNTLVYNNSASTGKGGEDIWYKGKDATGKISIELPAASEITDGEINGSGWYDEVAGVVITAPISVPVSATTTTAKTYTFLYGLEQVAAIGENTYPSVQAAVDDLSKQISDTQEMFQTVTLLKNSWEDVNIPDGVKVVLDLNGKTLRGTTGSVITVAKGAELTIQDSSQEQTGKITDGRGTVNAIESSETLSGDKAFGGGLLIHGTVTLESGMITGNKATYGAGVYVSASGSFNMAGGSISGNTGTGVYVNHSEITPDGTHGGIFTMTDGIISNNTSSVSGGGIALYSPDAEVVVIGGVISDNTVTGSGGGIYIRYGQSNISGVTISGNKATISGAGIAVGGDAILILTDSVISDNTTTGSGSYGGGIAVTNGEVSVEGCTITNNVALSNGNGGGIGIKGGTLTVKDSTITQNRAYNEGGGIYANPGSVKVLTSKLYQNTSNGNAKDIWLGTGVSAGSEIISVNAMDVEGYNAWYDTWSRKYIEDTLFTKSDTGYYLTAVNKNENTVARIGENKYSTLQAALNAAQAGDVIYLTEDICESVNIKNRKETPITVDLNGYTLETDGNQVFFLYNADLTIQDTSQADEPQPDAKVDSTGGVLTMAEGNTAGRAIYASGSKLTLKGGIYTGFSGMENGGAIYMSNVNFEMTGGSIRDNKATGAGGGIYILSANNNQIKLTGGEICGNSAAGSGGGLYFVGSNASTAQMEILFDGIKIIGNKAGSAGGGFYLHTGAKTTVITGDTLIKGNTAGTHGGGALIYYTNNSSSGQFVEISGGTIEENQAVTNGGGMYIAGNVKMSAGIIRNNMSTTNGGFGGGIDFYSFDTVEVSGGDFLNNQASYGGGFRIGSGKKFIMNDANIIGNQTIITGGRGGGIYLGGSCVDVQLNGGVIKNNRATYGGGFAPVGSNSYQVVVLNGVQILDNYANTGGGLYTYYTMKELIIQGDTLIDGNTADTSMGGGLYWTSNGKLTMTGGRISNNTAKTHGGGLALLNGVSYEISGGEISANTAANGGGIYYSEAAAKEGKTAIISGGVIKGNYALTNGGGIYHTAYAPPLTISGGEVTENIAKSNGGGVWISSNQGYLNLKDNGKLYSNIAGLGQDVYANHSASTKNTTLKLMKAADMGEAGKWQGISWYEEQRRTVIEDAVDYDPTARIYALTLQYETFEPVAQIGDNQYRTVQEAVNAVQAAVKSGEWNELYPDGKIPDDGVEILMIADSKENVIIPAAVKAILNLNGHLLNGFATAITCDGELIVRDDPKGDRSGDGVGTISGTAYTSGGGILVRGGGYVKMESGQISGSYANGNGNNALYGGGGVCVSRGTFELTGTAVIRNCEAYYGSAVYVMDTSSTFIMSGGSIEENNCLNYGTVYVRGGLFRMTGGQIINNTTTYYGGGVYGYSGRIILNGSGEEIPKICNNVAGTKGGGVAIGNADATVELRRVEISDNFVPVSTSTDTTQGAGGGVYGGVGTIKIYDGALIKNNTAEHGGGVFLNTATVRMAGGEITGNTADLGGGVAQNPLGDSSFIMTGGQIYENHSRLKDAGHDIYSAYEGADPYPGANTIPAATVIAASEMGLSKYNVWKNDSYTGENMVGETILDGYYITGKINSSHSLQLTASKFGDLEDTVGETTYAVKSLQILNSQGDAAMTDGTSVWDNVSAAEVSAGELLESGEAVKSESTYIYNGKEYEYIIYNGEKYEQDQAVSWSPGDDNSAQNSIVRTYDTVSYSLTTTIEDTDREDGVEEPGTEADTLSDEESTQQKQKLRLCIEAILPCSSDEAEFSLSAAGENSDVEETVDAEGNPIQIFRGYWDDEYNVGAASTNQKSLTIRIKGMKNGDLLKPVFRAWIEGNEENEKHPVECASKMLTISAASRYNVLLLRNSELAYTGWFDLESGQETTEEDAKNNSNAVYGTMLGYGLTLELYNNNTNKYMKGIELPKDQITFELDLSGSLWLQGEELRDGDGNPIVRAPYVWAYKDNNNESTYGTSLSGTNYDVNMDWNDEDDSTKTTSYAWNAAPLNNGNNTYSCYSGGVWSASGVQPKANDEKTTVTFTVDGYAFGKNSDYNPTRHSDNNTANTANSLISPSYIKAFSAGYIQVVYPIDKEVVGDDEGYLEINMNGMVSKLEAEGISGQKPQSTENGINIMQEYYGDDYKQYAVNEMTYGDNYVSFNTGLYIYHSTNGDTLTKTNFFNTTASSATTSGSLSGSNGTGSTPIGSQVYLGATVTFGSERIDTRNPQDSEHYIENFDPQVHNTTEYNYMTAMNLLQKFDADVFTPVGTEAIINKQYSPTTNTQNIGTGNVFRIITNETSTVWSETTPYKTQSYNLTILYGAKPDGSNWTDGSKTQTQGGDMEMDQYEEEDLIYFETLQDLYDYFGYDAEGNPKGKCVALLYQFRDCCIRSGHYIAVISKMQVTDEFEKTGKTYCTTNDAKCWSTYRPDYKEAYANGTLNDPDNGILYNFNWTSQIYKENSDITVYGAGNGNLPAGYAGNQMTEFYEDGYVKTEYNHGSKVDGTHTGWRAGNSLLLYTLDSGIAIRNTDLEQNSNSVKQYYYLHKGERVANFEITPTLVISSSTKNHELVVNGSQATEVEIELTLPKYLTYREGSIAFDYSAPGCEYRDGEMSWEVVTAEPAADGTTKITFRTVVTDINKGLPMITYACTIGTPGAIAAEDVPDRQSLTTKVSINTTYMEISQIASQMHEGEVTIIPVRDSLDEIYKEVDSNLVELGTDLAYTLNYINSSGNSMSIDLYDILPYNNDGRSTLFTGGYRVKGIELIFSDEDDYKKFIDSAKGGWLSYKSGLTTTQDGDKQATILNEAKAENGWHRLSGDYADEAEVATIRYDLSGIKMVQLANIQNGYGIYGYIPNIEPQQRLQIRITLSPLEQDETGATGTAKLIKDASGNVQTGNNVYWNNFIYRSGSATPVMGGKVFVRTVSRTLSGLVWMDQDQDGKYVAGTSEYPSTDALLKGVDVYLYTRDGSGELTNEVYDVMGNRVEKVTTDEKGQYTFTNLAAGEYFVVFKDDGGDYAVASSAAQPIAFSRLSVTPERDTVRYTMPGALTDKALPVYDTPDSELDGFAQLDAAMIHNGGEDGTGISLPALENVGVGQYITQNWNCGLYYKEIALEKQWVNVTDIEDGVSVELKMTATIGNDDTGSTESEDAELISYDTVFTLTKDGNKVTVATEPAGYADVAVQSTTDSAKETVTWKMDAIPLQAEGAAGVITYTFEETAKDGDGEILLGYVDSLKEVTDSSTNVTTVTARNAKIRYGFNITKVSANTNESGEHPVIEGAEFTLYTDEDCTKAVKSLTSDQDGLLSFEKLDAGTYYLKETKTVTGYSLNKGIFKIEVKYQEPAADDPEVDGAEAEAAGADAADTSVAGDDAIWRKVPVITVTQITDSRSGENLAESAVVTVNAEITPELSGVTADKLPELYRISFRVENECIYELPQTGSRGIWWMAVSGVILMILALWLTERRKCQNQ